MISLLRPRWQQFSWFAVAAFCSFHLVGTWTTVQAAGFTPEDLVMMNRLSDPQVSPDGRWVAYTLRATELANNRGNTDIHLLDLRNETRPPVQLTRHAGADFNPRWSADSQQLFFLSTRSGSTQVWRLKLSGGEAEAVTQLPLDVHALKVSPTGTHLLIAMNVYADCANINCTATRLSERGKQTSSGLEFEQLLVRHWDQWEDGRHSHLFSLALTPKEGTAEPIDLMRGVKAHVPSRPMGGDEEFAFSRDGQQVVYSVRMADRTEAWSTNFDLWQVSVQGGTPRNLTVDNLAWDTQPRFMADGSLVWLAMRRAGFEADQLRLMQKDAKTGKVFERLPNWPLSIGHLESSFDGRSLLFTADDRGQTPLFRLDTGQTQPTKLAATGQVTGFSDSSTGTVFALASLAAPPDLYAVTRRGTNPRALTAVNRERLSARARTEFESFSFVGAAGAQVQGHVMKPAEAVPGRKYPIAMIVHGGPQAAFGNAWSYRWNPKTFAGAGYAVLFIDFHGTPGYGQDFTDSISGDWGGKPLEDIKAGFAAALARYDFLDGERACALGASYGGYMINWIASQWPDAFDCLVNHAGIFDARSMYYMTEELWFPEWENGGPYYERTAAHEKFNPANHVQLWRTPMLVTHGQLDYRVPYTQGLATFTALQRRGIKSRLLMFPDENHWIQKPHNSLRWYSTVLGWLDEHLKK